MEFLPSSCPLFCLSGKQAFNCFFSKFPAKIEGLDDCLFQAIEKFGDKPLRPAQWKPVQLTALKKITTPCKLFKD